ncbi:sodium-potassium ATPase [Amylostereum chailletii]|nr:sodium-potassium ATPase [Amylostereum chailletii]
MPSSLSNDVEAQKGGSGGLPRSVTIDAPPQDARHGIPYSRTLSRNDTIEVANRLPVEFRTLSIQVNDTKTIPIQEPSKNKGSAVKDLASLDWHKISIDEALRRLAVSPNVGLDSPQVARRIATYGRNIITPPKSNMLLKVLGWIFGGFGSLLLAASIVCFIAWKPLGEPAPQASNLALAIVLLVVIVLQAIFNAWQDFSTSRVMASIKDMLPADVVVIRDGAQSSMAASELVPGDIVNVVLGQKVPADLRLVEVSTDLKFDRSVLTGESEPISGRVDMTDENTKNIALQGTLCVNGSGMGLVIQTGDNTVFGQIAKMSSASPAHMTTLQREILRFVMIIASLAFSVAVLVVILWAAWLKRDHPDYITVPTLLIDVVSVMVAFIPEGLPIAVTISLAKVAHTLSKHKVLCKSLSIVETLGSVNVLCSDKTGTLTQNKMHVEDAAIYDTAFSTASLNSAAKTSSPPVTENLCQLPAVAAICNGATFHGADAGVEREAMGDATDSAILRFADTLIGADAMRSQWRTVYKMNFNSKTKYMLTLSKVSNVPTKQTLPPWPVASWDSFETDDLLLCVKGAPEMLFPRCTHVNNPKGGPPIKLLPVVQQRIVSLQESWAAQGRRVLVLARRIVPRHLLPKELDSNSEEFEGLVQALNSQLVIVGLVGLIDPLKTDIPETVRICRGAGIRFFVVTGDHPATSVAIAAQAGIITNVATVHRFADLVQDIDDKGLKELQALQVPGFDGPDDVLQSIVITGLELDALTPAQAHRLYGYSEIVFARTSPEQKLRIVKALQERACVVAMTGDGVNDAPSLRAADCGIAMGSGSDVAKEAADMILLEDFSAIVVALEYGRLVYENLKKTILYLLPAGSFSELMPILLNVIFGVPQMLSNIQMILICVATDVLPTLSMCFEPPESGLLARPPRNSRTERLADWRLLLHAYGFLGVIESLCAMSMSFWFLQRRGVPFSSLAFGFGNWPGLTNDLLYEAQTIYFFTLVIMQWGNLLATRTRKSSILQLPPTWSVNRTVLPAALLALSIGIFFCYVPAFHTVFQTHTIPVEYFFLPMTFGLGLLILDEVRKVVVRRYPHGGIGWLAW